MNRQITSIIVLVIVISIITPVEAISEIVTVEPALEIHKIDDITTTISEVVKINVTAEMIVKDIKVLGGFRYIPPEINVICEKLPIGGNLQQIESGILKSVAIFTFEPVDPGIYNITFVAQSMLFQYMSDNETVTITVLQEPEDQEDNTHNTVVIGGFGGFGTGRGVGPIHPTGMYMHAKWGMMDYIEEHTGTTRDELEDMTTLQIVRLFYEVKTYGK